MEEGINEEALPIIECPEIYAKIEGIQVTALVDSGSRVTTISEEFYLENTEILKNCPLLPVTGVTVKGAIKGKLTKVRNQIMAMTEIGKVKTYIKFLIVPGLIRDVLLGVDSLQPLKSLIDLGAMSLQGNQCVKNILTPMKLYGSEILWLLMVLYSVLHLSSIDTTCGFDPRFFEILKLSLSKKDEIQKHGILLIDEMATRESVHVNSKTLSYKGLIDFGKEGEQASDFNEKANHGLVIMFHPLYDDYTQPIAVFASRGSVKGDVLAKLIVKAIVLLENAGAKIHGVVTDGASTNRKFWSEMGISGQRKNLQNSFEHPVDERRRVFVFSDTPHLVKTIRNRLYGKKILQMDPTESPIKWDDIEMLHKKDKELAGPGQVLMCPKLSSNHFALNNASKMRVRLAVQVFSNTVACGLRFFQQYVPELKDCEGTAAFCEWINQMFDALNRKDDIEGMQPGNTDFKILEDSIRKLDEWEEKVEKGLLSKDLFLTPQTAEGLRVTLKSTLDIVTYLTNECGFPYVLTGRINQDPLEVKLLQGLDIYSCRFEIKLGEYFFGLRTEFVESNVIKC
ncbi:uncharacterized protein [Venturia canescens]|uniref:uncharacterized protein n=1 Tax=Venturia canescens TaxID=32260 RepID=UPI001C9C853C|nr:uncharacterized protein LOC122417765 [Venturia canescens]